MKTKFTLLMTLSQISVMISFAQTNTFPATGNVGIGTLTPATDLQVKGKTRMGSSTDYVQVDGNGNLNFKGAGGYQVGGNKYVFHYSASPGYGLFFNSTDTIYEFRDAAARPVFSVNGNSGDGYFLGGVRIGNSTLTTAGNLRWTGSDFEGYTGTAWTSLTKKGWLLTGNAGTNPAVNFIGTTDAQPLIFKVNNQKAGYIDFDGAKSNTGFGYQTLFSNSTGVYNTANGYAALYSNTTGFANTANGINVLYSNTIGFHNTASGYQALFFNTAGERNTAYGSSAASSNGTGNSNTAFGFDALYDNQTGSGNTAVGHEAGLINMMGSNNTSIGTSAGPNANNFSNNTTLGYNATGTADNQVRIGNSNVTSIGGFKAWTNLSDGRIKKNIKANVPGLSFINLLKPVTYTFDLNAADKISTQPSLKDKTGKTIQPSQEEINARHAQEQVVSTGFIAQDVEAAAKRLGYDFDGVDAPKNDKDLYGLRYAEFVVPLVKAVQELSKMNDNKDAKINELEARLSKLESIMSAQSTTAVLNQQTTSLTSASLSQNIPNPFNSSTTINYNLPQKINSAKIIITDKNGKTIKQFNLTSGGKGSLQVDASSLSSGAYQYVLYVDEKMIDSKQMAFLK